jgi:Na+/proline symporter
VASIAAGMTTTLGWEIYARIAGGHPYELDTVYPALALSLIALVGVSLLTPPPSRAEREAIA